MPDSDLRGGDIRPVPDPTALTTDASIRQEGMLRNLITAEIGHLEELLAEKLLRIDGQFRDLSQRTAEQKKDTKDALDAALAAQKEAVASQTASSEKSITKSETATIERIKAVETLLTAFSQAINDKIDDLKSRIVALEAIKLGATQAVTERRDQGSDTRSIIAALIGGVLFLISVASIIFAIAKP